MASFPISHDRPFNPDDFFIHSGPDAESTSISQTESTDMIVSDTEEEPISPLPDRILQKQWSHDLQREILILNAQHHQLLIKATYLALYQLMIMERRNLTSTKPIEIRTEQILSSYPQGNIEEAFMELEGNYLTLKRQYLETEIREIKNLQHLLRQELEYLSRQA